MFEQTLVGFYHTHAVADEVRTRLEAEGVIPSDISIGGEAGDLVHETADTAKPTSGFWAWLLGTGVSDEQRERYTRHLRDGSVAVSVVTRADAERDRAIEVMEQFEPIDIEGDDGRSVALEAQPPSTVAERDQVIPLAKEELEIGKRQVERRHRIRTHVVEQPVEAQVHLRDERVIVERRPASATTAASLDPGFKESDVEIIERHEEPVVAKRTRAAEEVVVRTEERERVEAVRDTLRETRVDVDQPSRDNMKDQGVEADAAEVVGAPPKP
jgi:stress response protein YsnF